MDERLPKINDSDLNDLFQATDCHRLSLCVCQGRGRQAKFCHDKTIQLLKPLLAVKKRTRGPDNKFIEKEPERTRARMLAESAELVLCFTAHEVEDSLGTPDLSDAWADFLMTKPSGPTGQTGSCAQQSQVPLPADPADKLYFHFGYVNFRSWESSGLVLHDCPSEDASEADADADALGEAGDAAVPAQGAQAEEEPRHESLQTLVVHEEEVVFRTLLETIQCKLDLNLGIHCELYEVVSLKKKIGNDRMKPNKIQVQRLHLDPVVVWMGERRSPHTASLASKLKSPSGSSGSSSSSSGRQRSGNGTPATIAGARCWCSWRCCCR